MKAFFEATWAFLPWLLLALILFNLAWYLVAAVAFGALPAMRFLVGLVGAAAMLGLWVFVEECL